MVELERSPVVKVGVALGPRPDDLAEWLADAAAFEAAGAEALWVGVAPADELDPLVLTAALAVVTSRALLLTSWPATTAPVQSLVTVGRLSRGRLRMVAVNDGQVYIEDDDDDDAHDPAEPWLTVPSPEHRSAWRATIVDAVERGYFRLMVPANPRLLDILRNPEEPGDRRDLQLASG